MKNIKADIANRTFKRVYLLYGEEVYLMRIYLNALKKAVLGDDASDVNYSFFDGNTGYDVNEMKELCETLPFFADYRLIIAQNSGLFGADMQFADFIDRIPESTVLILLENSADKRTALFKAIKEKGYTCEFTTPTPEQLNDFVRDYLSKSGKRIGGSDCGYFVNGVGGDLYNITSELDKLTAYIGDRDTITRADIDAVCSMQIENRIFDIVECLLNRNIKAAMSIYFDLIALREQPIGILRYIQNQFLKFNTIKHEIEDGKSDAEICSSTRTPDWLLRKIKARIKGYSAKQLMEGARLCLDTESTIKSGDLSEAVGLEILLANLASL